ncbi:MAG: M15 family metallopeptidase [Clostridiales bacterium]|nr:M15 family metallopeptidase [Clostridiales bacterium]
MAKRRKIRLRGKNRIAAIIGGTAFVLLLITLIVLRVGKRATEDMQTQNNEIESSVTEWSEKVTSLLWLINAEHILPQSYVPEGLENLPNSNVQIVEEAGRAYMRMTQDMEEPLYVANGYISATAQQNLYDSKRQQYLEEGYTEERANMVIVDEYFPGGADEHQLGLTVDVCTDETLNLDMDFQLTAQGQWLMEHAWEYGFVFRGTEGAPKIYKPWQLRYVGETHAAIMQKLHLSLDEYLAYLEDKGTSYFSDVGAMHLDLIVYFADSLSEIPLKIREVSGDNNGHYIVVCYR